MERILKILAFILIIQSVAFCSDVTIQRNVPLEITLGDTLQVNISITNIENTALNLTAEETLPSENEFEYMIPENRSGYQIYYLKIPFLSWDFYLEPYQEKIITYSIKPKYPGIFNLRVTHVYGDGISNYSEPAMVKVLCKPDGFCNTSIGENNEFCPQDCSTGIADNDCDMVRDGKCDPDCISGDPDCSASCGDGKCNGIENAVNCPRDCQTGQDASGNWNWYLILAAAVIILAVAAYAIIKYKERSSEEKILRKIGG